jgi:hypothetical protein
MAALKNARHERFAQEIAKGQSASDAYVSAGYGESRSAASRLSTNVNIAARVAEILNKAATKTELTVASITERLLAIAAKGETSGGAPLLSVARAALMDAAKLNGLVIDKAEGVFTGAMTVTYVTSASGPAPTPSDEDYETGA